MRIPAEVESFATLLSSKRASQPLIQLGELSLSGCRAKLPPFKHGQLPGELLGGSHDYEFTIGYTTVQVSTRLFRNIRDHYRLFAYSRVGASAGMLFSLNLTTTKDAHGVLGLSQRIRFAEGRGKTPDSARAIREAKGRVFADVLIRSGIPVSDNLEVQLGTYSGRANTFLDTTPAKFISQFLSVALLKGHFQGNKGYQFACLPRFDDSFSWKWDSSGKVRAKLTPNKKGAGGSRLITLALRFQVLERDRARCCVCGTGPHAGATLHIDHIVPWSLGGLTTLSNLQTLCQHCNLGKGNRSTTDYRKQSGSR